MMTYGKWSDLRRSTERTSLVLDLLGETELTKYSMPLELGKQYGRSQSDYRKPVE